MDAPKSSATAPRTEDHELRALEDRSRNELMGEEERGELLDRVLRLRRKATAKNVGSGEFR